MCPRYRCAQRPTARPVGEPSSPTGAELSRIATYLRDDTVHRAGRAPDGFDLAAVLTAVRGVAGVRDANLRWNSGSGHTLRIEFDDSADEGQVTREVARLLRETMGLAAPTTGPSRLRQRPARRRGEHASIRPRSGRRRSAPPACRAACRPARRPPNAARPTGASSGPRVVLDHVQVTTLGVEADGGGSPGSSRRVPPRCRTTAGVGRMQGPAVDAYLLRLAASACGDALDQLLVDSRTGTSAAAASSSTSPSYRSPASRSQSWCCCSCVAPTPSSISGSAIVAGDPRQAVVRATLSAANRRLQSLLAEQN